ncbi:unnamed protein product [Adineta ricciae]|uniref:FAM20 C-terminal domain-containing protein n=1 Tax=Adineta ricciae TaxID=249248 RepID=A0A813T4B6_ADIRI|nr:unnamed protein product [Adineta ricciae]
MRYLRLRLRSSIVVGLTITTFFSLTTLYIFLRSANELERPIHFIKGKPGLAEVSRYQSLRKKSNRIHELYQLVRENRIHQAKLGHLLWNLKKFHKGALQVNRNDTNTPMETGDSGDLNKQPIKLPINLTTTSTNFNQHDKMQLRQFILHVLTKWKIEHQNDTSISLADIMHESLVQDNPERLNTAWYQQMKTVTNSRVYNPNSVEFRSLLNHLQNGSISEASELSQGTQIKLILQLPDGLQALLKPYRVPRNYQTLPDHFYFSDIERHHAEIAAFHLDKVLGFNRVPPLIGRLLNVTSDIRDKATEELASTFFISPANNTCFRGHCSYYCDTSHAVCGKPGNRLEGSVQLLLPRPPEVDWQKITHPYRRSYSAVRKAEWETNENYCYEHVMIDEDYHNRLLLDMMDLCAFDFLTGNLDRHHMMRISSFGINTALIHLDNGRSFGRYDTDDLSILAPIRQCCFFRYSTFMRLYNLYQKGLSKLLSTSLNIGENLPKILIEDYLVAVDRRLEILFAQIDSCFQTYTVKEVMIDDGIE